MSVRRAERGPCQWGEVWRDHVSEASCVGTMSMRRGVERPCRGDELPGDHVNEAREQEE